MMVLLLQFLNFDYVLYVLVNYVVFVVLCLLVILIFYQNVLVLMVYNHFVIVYWHDDHHEWNHCHHVCYGVHRMLVFVVIERRVLAIHWDRRLVQYWMEDKHLQHIVDDHVVEMKSFGSMDHRRMNHSNRQNVDVGHSKHFVELELHWIVDLIVDDMLMELVRAINHHYLLLTIDRHRRMVDVLVNDVVDLVDDFDEHLRSSCCCYCCNCMILNII